MHYAAGGPHELSAVSDVLELGRASSENGSAIANLLWADLVGKHLSVEGALDVRQNQQGQCDVALAYALPADDGRLAERIGAPLNFYGLQGQPSYGKAGYSWAELQTIADAIASTRDSRYGMVIAERYGVCPYRGEESDKGPTTWIKLADGTIREVLLSGVMEEVDQGDETEPEFVGFVFVSADDDEALSFGLGGSGEGLPEGASTEYVGMEVS